MSYEAFCSNRGMVALGRKHLVNSIENILKVQLKVYREDGVTVKRYVTPGIDPENVTWLDNGYAFAKKTEIKAERPQQEELGRDW
jgi:hypothetical protein